MSPKAFISYSWSSVAHQEWVLRLATELRESGVNVTFDKWDLKEGHDAHAFMEQMVTDPTIEKVILVCDKVYAEKADGRSGGVGTEAQIVTPELYGKQRQDKFVAVIAEKDSDGNACLPTFFKSRIYIDLSNDAVYSEGFIQLLRWAYGKPLHVKPKLGAAPSFLTSAVDRPTLPTAAKFRHAGDSLRNGQPHASAAASEYFNALVENLENFRIKSADFTRDTFDEAVIKSIDDFLPYRLECISIFSLLASYIAEDKIADVLHKFFEGLIPYMDRPDGVSSGQEWDYDNFRFIVYDLFLHTVSILIKNGKFTAVARFLETEYYIRTEINHGDMRGYAIFMRGMDSFEHRKQRLCLNTISLQADMLKERCKGLPVEFRDLIQADFVMFLRARLAGKRWYPITAVFMGPMGRPLEIFARSKSRRYFDRIAPIIGVSSVKNFQARVKQLAADPQNLPGWHHHTLPVTVATGIDQIGTTA